MKVQVVGVVLEWTQQHRRKDELSEFCLLEAYVDEGWDARDTRRESCRSDISAS